MNLLRPILPLLFFFLLPLMLFFPVLWGEATLIPFEWSITRAQEIGDAGMVAAFVALYVAGIAALLMSIFTLGTMISGALFQISRMGQLMQEYSSIERLTAVISNHPFAFAVAVFVIGYYIYKYFTEKKWQEG